ncbi:hypothetical protein KKG83_05855 [Candidatus Micrarchaeota archaeon]|nr:hypothetical protein [Candidatus Micrarchaeota archaeon]
MKKLVFKTKINCPYPIVDNEIRNNLVDPATGKWDYEKALLSVVGVWNKNKITQISLRKGNEEKFKDKLKKLLDGFNELHAFNRLMENGNFKGYLNKEYCIKEIKLVKGKGITKEFLFNLLLKNAIPKEEIELTDLNDPLEGNHHKMMEFYEKNRFNEIEKANRICLTKEFFIKKYSEWLLKNMNLDKNNWIIK